MTGAAPFALFAAVYRRDLRLAARRKAEALLPPAFFAVAVTLFPLGVGPEPRLLQTAAAGLVWVCALLAAMLSVHTLYALDHADGSLEQLLLAGEPVVVAAAKAAAHWSVSGAPLLLAAPLAGALLGLGGEALGVLALSLLLGTPLLSLLGNLGAALTLGLRGGELLVVLIVLPLAVPVLVFATGAVAAVQGGLSPAPHFALLGAMLIAGVLLAPLATAAALRIAVA